MISVFNKSNRPIGIAGQSVLPDKEITVKDKDAYCAVFDEYGNDTGKKAIVPGLIALQTKGYVTIRVIDEAPAEKSEEEKAAEKKAAAAAKRAATLAKKKAEKEAAEKTE